MKVGTICYATDQGLGVLARDFYDNGVVTDVLVVEHAHRPTRKEWYPDSESMPIHPFDFERATRFCRRMDAMMFFETPFHWGLLSLCRQSGVKTVLMPMYECMPTHMPYPADVIVNPSDLDARYYPSGVRLNVPVPKWVEYRKRGVAKTFVHNAGHGGLMGRNGTGELIDAMRHVKADVKLILRSQKKLEWGIDDPRVEVRVGTVPREELYSEGEVFVFPEKFNGLSLPLQEAFASGMAVVSTNRFPMNGWLPTEYLIEPAGERENRVSGRCHKFSESVIDPEDIALAIDRIAYTDVGELSEAGRKWAEENSWDRLGRLYTDLLG